MRNLSLGMVTKVLVECAKSADKNGYFTTKNALKRVRRKYKNVLPYYSSIAYNFSGYVHAGLVGSGYVRHIKSAIHRGKFQIYQETVDRLLDLGLLK